MDQAEGNKVAHTTEPASNKVAQTELRPREEHRAQTTMELFRVQTRVNMPPDKELLKRAILRFKSVKNHSQGVYRWYRVSELLGLGSTYSKELCRRLELDPDVLVRKTLW